LTAVAAVAVAAPAFAQFDEPETPRSKGVGFGKELTQRYKVGIVVRAVGGPCRGLYATVPVPTDWPEQEVKIVDEDFSPSVRSVRYRTLAGGVKQMLISIPMLPAGKTANALVTFQVRRRLILAPEDTSIFSIPERLDPRYRQYLAPSIYIETRQSKIRSLAKEIVREKESAWEKAEAIYQYVRDHVEHRTSNKRKGAARALRDGFAGNNDVTSVFIALCRAARIPARTVWVTGHSHAEFYLHDDEGKGHWIPCQVVGSHDFGSISDHRMVLQKGDNFQVPEKRERVPFVAEFLKGSAFRGAGKPQVKFVRQPMTGG